MRRTVKLVVVRHGQATHNLPTFKVEDMVMTTDEQKPIMNSPLTEEGRRQAGQVANRLATTAFDLALSSDLTRAWDKALAIVKRNPSLKEVKECQLLRERNFGVLENLRDVLRAQWKVEGAIDDRELLDWRIPGGDSVLDLRERTRALLKEVQAMALGLEEEAPTILLVSHGGLMKELYYILVAQSGEKDALKSHPPNTGIDQYTLTTVLKEDGETRLESVRVDLLN